MNPQDNQNQGGMPAADPNAQPAADPNAQPAPVDETPVSETPVEAPVETPQPVEPGMGGDQGEQNPGGAPVA